jgi:hypothetical protein
MPKSQGPHQQNRLVPVMVLKYGPGFHNDGNCLYLKVAPSGARQWIVRTTIQGHRSDVVGSNKGGFTERLQPNYANQTYGFPPRKYG